MSIFASNPIKINIVKNDEITKIIVFVGSVPLDVENALKKIEKGSSPSGNSLRKFYGSDWKTKLGVEFLKKGGNEEDVLNHGHKKYYRPELKSISHLQ